MLPASPLRHEVSAAVAGEAAGIVADQAVAAEVTGAEAHTAHPAVARLALIYGQCDNGIPMGCRYFFRQ